MTPADVRVICISLNDERGTGRQRKLARLFKWHHSTVRHEFTGKSLITASDALAIQKAVQMSEGQLPLADRSV
jgi:DNA-binding transcriptional regulator YdaS (Cro superfamily)